MRKLTKESAPESYAEAAAIVANAGKSQPSSDSTGGGGSSTPDKDSQAPV